MRRLSDRIRDDNFKLRLALRAAPLGIWDWNLLTNEMSYSPRARAICGFTPDEAVTIEKVRNVTHPEDLPRTTSLARDALDPAVRSKEPYEYRIRRADTGEVRWMLAYGEAVFLSLENRIEAVRFLGTIEDITARKETEHALIEAELRHRLAIDAARMAIWEYDIDTDTVVTSPDLNRMFGLPPDAKPTMDEFGALYAPGERERVQVAGRAAIAAGQTNFEAEFRCKFPDGSLRWRLLRAQVLFSFAGQMQRVIGVLMDIDEQKRAEERQQLLLREVHHRVKNSLSVVQALATQSFGGGQAEPKALSSFRGRLVALAKATDVTLSSRSDPFSLRDLLTEIIEPYADTDRISLIGRDVKLPPRLNVPLALVFHELCTNAAKYGALSTVAGRLNIQWEEVIGGIGLTWYENGGPPVPASFNASFGLNLVLKILPVEVGEIGLEPKAEGVRFRMLIRS